MNEEINPVDPNFPKGPTAEERALNNMQARITVLTMAVATLAQRTGAIDQLIDELEERFADVQIRIAMREQPEEQLRAFRMGFNALLDVLREHRG